MRISWSIVKKLALLAALGGGACDNSSLDVSVLGASPGNAKTAPRAPANHPSPINAASPGGLLIEPVSATTLGTNAFTPNARIRARGKPTTYWIEYGPDEAYGSRTTPQALGPRLGAHYHESWDNGTAGWYGGISSKDLRHQPRGGMLNGYVRYSEQSADDKNHADGIGYVHLTQYFASGTFVTDDSASFGGGDPDFRDAKVSLYARGVDWQPNGSELVFWLQSDLDLALANDPELWRKANWAYSGNPLTDFLAAGTWQHVEYRLLNDTNLWSYAGKSLAQQRDNYTYWSLDEALHHANCDFFHILTLIRPGGPSQPWGSIDYDEFDLVYRNTSLLVPSNGGKLIASPSGSPDKPEMLTDGWRFGDGRAWRSGESPQAPLEFTYELANPVTVRTIQIHQHPEFPSREIEVLLSSDGSSWRSVAKGEMPESAPGGPNFAYFWAGDLKESARFAKVVVSSGYRAQRWGLGEIEMFGSGAVMATDDDWYSVNQDILGLAAGKTYHYRFVAESNGTTYTSTDESFTVPASPKPETITRGATRVANGQAKIEGRMNPMGLATQFHFEYGKDTSYGLTSEDDYGGIERSPRTVIALLSGLEPGATYHYRLVATNSAGTSFGVDRTFVAR